MAEEVEARITKKKPMYPVSPRLRGYMEQYNRAFKLPVSYTRLCEWAESVPLQDGEGHDTLWRTVIYRPEIMSRLNKHLTAIYAMLKTEGDISFVDHLYVDRIDYCSFGNSNPFRIRIVNSYNENQDYYYIKRADASRLYGLELEHLLSPNRMHYLVDQDILVEEHIVGIPGDIFIQKWLGNTQLKRIRLAKELVKFNERSFLRLLGDMRSYNFVVDVTPDFEEVQIRIRAMDFDQQSYSGRKNFYRPQFFKENLALVEFCIQQVNMRSAQQYQREEQATIYRRMHAVSERIKRLLDSMRSETVAPPEHITELRDSLAEHYQNDAFQKCHSMGDIVHCSLMQIESSLANQRAQVYEYLGKQDATG